MSSSAVQGSVHPKGRSRDRRHNTRKYQPRGLVVGTGIMNVSSTPTAPPVSPSISSISEDVCGICAEPVKFYAVSDCNHRTCHFCALRLRALYQKRECTYCKVSLIPYLLRFHSLQLPMLFARPHRIKLFSHRRVLVPLRTTPEPSPSGMASSV